MPVNIKTTTHTIIVLLAITVIVLIAVMTIVALHAPTKIARTETETTTTPETGETTGGTDVIRILNGTLYLTRMHQPINDYYFIVWIEVNLEITLKNTGDRIVTIRDITVDGLKLLGFTTFNINPGETVTKYYPIILNPDTGEIRIIFEPNWEKGTSHIVTITYVVFGTTIEQKVSQTIVVA